MAIKRTIWALALAMGIGGGAMAQEAAPLAQVGLQARIEALSADTQAHGFEIGMLLSLRAIERTMQTRYEFGLGDNMIGLHVLRMEFGARNPRPKSFEPETIGLIFSDLLNDLQQARAVLGNAAARGAIHEFDLTLQDIWFDINGSGTRDDFENLTEGLLPLVLGWRVLRDATESGLMNKPLQVRFDEADHAWLMAYTHMLSGVGEIVLAFDPAPVIAGLAQGRAKLDTAPSIPNTFDPAALQEEIAALEGKLLLLEEALEPIAARLKAMNEEWNALRAAEPRDEDATEALGAKINDLRRNEQRPLRRQIRSLQAEISAAELKEHNPNREAVAQFMPQVDMVYILLNTLRQQPDGVRMSAARDHWLAMIAQNDVFWTKLALETDNTREWIPNPAQDSVLPVTVDQGMIDGWQGILEDAEAVLEGRLLVPHMLLPAGTGINLKAYFEDPAPLDIIEWIHGAGAYPYAAKGPMLSQQRWRAFQRLTGGNAGGFALFFN